MKTALAILALSVLTASAAAARRGTITADTAGSSITLADGKSNLVLRVKIDHACRLESVLVRGQEVLSPMPGVYSAIQVSNRWFTTSTNIASPKTKIGRDSLTLSQIRYGGGGVDVNETWRFKVHADRIDWEIERTYFSGGRLEDACSPAWEFSDMSTWTGGLLDNGGVAWNKYLETPNATLGMHAAAVTFWNKDAPACLRITSEAGASHTALRFSRQPSGSQQVVFSVSDSELKPKHNLCRFLANRQDLWAPFTVAPGQIQVTYRLEALDYPAKTGAGVLRSPGLSGNTIRELLNTIGRYGVIDRRLVGANGWRTGFICYHEQWFSQIGLALADPDYIANCAASYDYARDHAIQPDGRVKARWWYVAGDAMPGTYDQLGFYEAQWGYLMDSQPAFAICVAEQFDLTGDLRWLRSHKASCERALDYLLKRDGDLDGLLEMHNRSHADQQGSDWIDIIWAAHENALVNAEMFHALERWAGLETLLGDSARAALFRDAAARLKASFNKPVAEGGFWDPANGWYIYWRDDDESIHGNNLVTPVNFAAIAYGVCDDPGRRAAILERIESEMQKEDLFFWPLNFFPYPREEGHANNFPYPKYENGDIFLSWGELAVRAYAQTDPAIALKYIRNVLARYDIDGLSFQRYLRASQRGAGEDILAGNCMTIVGLYRNIYGIQPRHNRLYLEPHLVPELNGSLLQYPLRDRRYTIDLSADSFVVGSGNFSLRSSRPCAINISDRCLEFFPGQSDQPQLIVHHTGRALLEFQLESWPEDPLEPKRWVQACKKEDAHAFVRQTIRGLLSGRSYEIRVNGELWRRVKANGSGQIEFRRKLGPAPEGIELLPVL